ncbi:MAG: UDP-N-acetylglucosamine 2-epimerase (non-hydrolyzing) [Phycisphaerales bacterium]|nr:UDP-N-acetylglucosamine 2-epimerase (non-hydrolyzing) [Phycisphaerales bacterium]
MIKVICVCGARPNFMKIAPLMRAFQASGRIHTTLVHTGQHYDERMSRLFFRDLGIPRPDVDLEVGSGSHAAQTAEVMKRFEPLCLREKPDWVVVVGDVNSTLACALVAVKLGIRVAHVEAGLRSFDRTMPEEINRLVTDAVSDLLLVTEPSGVENLRAEGMEASRIHLVGNVMIDTLLSNRRRAEESRILEDLRLAAGAYYLVTLHRPSNVDSRETLAPIMDALIHLARERCVVFPVHPRTRKNLESFGYAEQIDRLANFRLIEPQGYLDFLKLTAHAFAVLTDSGGVQEETTLLGVPCLTLRRNTERPITLTEGTNRLVEPTREGILAACSQIRDRNNSPPRMPHLWDGQAAERICTVLLDASRLVSA